VNELSPPQNRQGLLERHQVVAVRVGGGKLGTVGQG
jgi:hypothetical protein